MFCVDPGKHMCAVAEFTYDGKLLSACWLPNSFAIDKVRLSRVLVEVPRIYPGSPVRPNDLMDLSFAAGQIAGAADNVQSVFPREWKGNVEKAIMTERIIALAKKRKEYKYATLPKAKSKQHNVWDAVGIGYWHFGYLNKMTIRRGGE